MTTTTLSELERELEVATSEHAQARNEAALAHSNETRALNRLNGVQKRIDEAVDALRKSASTDSDWRRRGTGCKP
jgi:hypothetical protein